MERFFRDLTVLVDRWTRFEVFELEELADLDLTVDKRHALRPLDRFFLRLRLDQPVAGDQLLRLGERPVNDARLAARKLHASALGAGLQARTVEHHARFDQLFVVIAHVAEALLIRHRARFRFLGRLDNHHESHFFLSLLMRRTGMGGIDMGG